MYPGFNNQYYNPRPPGYPPPNNPQPPLQNPAMSSYAIPPFSPAMNPHDQIMYPSIMYPPWYRGGYPPMAPPMPPPMSPPMSPPIFNPESFATSAMERLPTNIPPGYLPPWKTASGSTTGTPQVVKTAKITPRKFTNEEALSQEEADWPCQNMGFNFLLRALVDLAGLSQDTVNYYTAWIVADVRWCMENKLDFGMAYAFTRSAWKVLSLPLHVDLARCRSMSWSGYNEAMKFRRAILHPGEGNGQELIDEPYSVKPSRIWDLKGNRVVDYIMMFSHFGTYINIRGVNMAQHPPLVTDIYPPFWAITHSWTKESDAAVYNTPVNSYQWPVRFPAGVTIEQVRRELLSFHGEGSDYIWLDVMCLRQDAGPQYAPIKAQEWKIDVPTIGNVYRLATCLVRYLNGLGRTMTTEGWDDERHWLRRAWTLQEIRPAEVTHTGGIPPDVVNPLNVIGKINGQEITLRNALAPVLALGESVASPGGCSVYSLVREMGRRYATNEVDKVAGLHYLLRTRRLPAYSASVTADEAWIRCFHELLYKPRLEILFDFPYRSRSGTRWFPRWSELMKWPERKPELNHTLPVWNAPDPFYLPHEFDPDPSQLYVPQVTLVTDVSLEIASNPGEYRVKFRGKTRSLGFFSPYINQDQIPNGHYTLATLNISAKCNWVVCCPKGQICLQTFWGQGPPVLTPLTVMRLAKVGVLRTDSVSDLRSENLLRGFSCLFV